MRLDFTLVHLSPLVNSYKGRDYFSAFVFYSANLKDLTNLTKLAASKGVLAACRQSRVLTSRMVHASIRCVLREIREICVRPNFSAMEEISFCVFCAFCVRPVKILFHFLFGFNGARLQKRWPSDSRESLRPTARC